MNKEEIEKLKDSTIDITDIDELALGLEVCSEKCNMVIQEFADTLIQLQKENKKCKEVIDKVRNNLEKDISVIKNVKMSNKEIICRLEETNKILKEEP